MLGYILVLPHILLLYYHGITILGTRILFLDYVIADVKFRLGWEAAPPITPTSPALTTISASAASLPTVTNSDNTKGVNYRDLAIITIVTSLADKKEVENMASKTGEIIMQSRGLDLGNAMINVLCIDSLQEEYYLLWPVQS